MATQRADRLLTLVEAAIARHPGVAEVCVIGVPDPKWIEAIAAVVVVKGDVTSEELIVHAKSTLAAHKVPKQVFLAEDLPKNPSGKVLKRELRAEMAEERG